MSITYLKEGLKSPRLQQVTTPQWQSGPLFAVVSSALRNSLDLTPLSIILAYIRSNVNRTNCELFVNKFFSGTDKVIVSGSLLDLKRSLPQDDTSGNNTGNELALKRSPLIKFILL